MTARLWLAFLSVEEHSFQITTSMNNILLSFATSTLATAIVIPVLAMFASLIGGLGGGWIVWLLNRNNERYIKLYGPLKYNLQTMKLITDNKTDVQEDIQEWKSVEMQIKLMEAHLSPLTKKWLQCRDNIRNLFEAHSGLVKRRDFALMSDFLDGCIKREIIEEGKNVLAINQNRTDKLLNAVKSLQSRLL